MRVCDWIAEFLYRKNIKNVHGLTGGGASGLNDGFISHGKIKYICYHHEQGAGHAAIGESKYTGKVSIVNPTTGCGGTNCITSVLNAWQDSVPVIFISGNVKKDACSRYIRSIKNVNLRKLGVQEHDIIETVKSITKASFFVEDAKEIPNIFNYAFFIAQHGRKGPVWIDIPSDIQTTKIDANFDSIDFVDNFQDNTNYHEIKELLKKSTRPLILAGYGIQQGGSVNDFRKFIEKYNIPYVSTYGARGLHKFDYKLNIGTVGIKGTRAGNFSIQNCDLLLIIGSSLGTSVTGYNPKQFSPNSFKIMVDIDEAELNKDIVKIDKKVLTTTELFFINMNKD